MISLEILPIFSDLSSTSKTILESSIHLLHTYLLVCSTSPDENPSHPATAEKSATCPSPQRTQNGHPQESSGNLDFISANRGVREHLQHIQNQLKIKHSPREKGGWNTAFLLGSNFFRGYLKLREGIVSWHKDTVIVLNTYSSYFILKKNSTHRGSENTMMKNLNVPKNTGCLSIHNLEIKTDF